MNYTFTDHLHNYAVWTAARASQRGFTTTENIKYAIEATGLIGLINKKSRLSIKGFDDFHQKTARIIIRQLKKKGIDTTYGRAAKLIAVYIKTAIVVRDSGKSILAKIAHPPIDNILLTSLNKTNKNLGLSGIKWTQLTEKEYFKLIDKLRTLNLEYFWELERYWTPVQNG